MVCPREWIKPSTELVFEPVEFLRQLATLIPPPYAHLTRFHGVFAPNHHLRAAVVRAPNCGAANVRPPGRCYLRVADSAAIQCRFVATLDRVARE